MKKLVVAAIVLLALAPAVAAQTAAIFTGKWEGTFKMQRPMAPRAIRDRSCST